MKTTLAAALGLLLATTAVEARAQALTAVPLPAEVTFPEGIAYDAKANAFYTASALTGTIARVDLKTGQSTIIAKAGTILPDDKVFPGALGLKVTGGQLWVSGGVTGKLWVLDAKTGAVIKTYETPKEPGALMNDVAIAGGYAYFTDSFRPVFYRAKTGAKPGELEPWLDFTGTPLAYDKGVNLNGIAATPDGKTLLVVQMNKGLLFKIDVATKKVTAVDLKGEAVPGADGLVLNGSTVYAVRQPAGEIVTIAMTKDLTSGVVTSRFADPAFSFPATAAVAGDRLLVVNTQFNKRAGGATTPFAVLSVPLAALNKK